MRYLIGFLLLSTLGTGLAAQLDSKIVFEDPALLELDYDAHLSNLLTYIKQNPADPNALAALYRAKDMDKQLRSNKPLFDMLQKLAEDDFRTCGQNSDDFVKIYAKLAEEYDITLSWQPVKQRWLGVRKWLYVGPFAENIAPAHVDFFPPEARFDAAATYDGAFGQIGWQAAQFTDPLSDEVNLDLQSRWSGYGYYLATSIIAAKDIKAVLQIDAGSAGKIWINGQPLAEIDTRLRRYPVLGLPVNLKCGTNLVLIKVSGVGNLSMKVRGESGRPLEWAVASLPSKPHVIESKPFPSHSLLPSTLREDILKHELTAPTIILEHNMRERGYELLETILERELACEKPNPYLLLNVLARLDDSPLHSGPSKRKLTRTIIETLEQIKGAENVTIFHQAKVLADNEQIKEATASFRKLTKSLPNAFQPWLELAKLYEEVDWRAEWKYSMTQATRLAPDSMALASQWEDFYSSKRNTAGEIEVDRRYLKTHPASSNTLLSLCMNLQRTGKPEEALKYARRATLVDPGSDFALERLAQSLILTGNTDEALEIYEQLAKRNPRPEGPLYAAASQCLKLGMDEKAVALLKRVLQYSPGRHDARRELKLLTGQDYGFWKRDASKWSRTEKWRKYDIKAEDFPRADSALILDELIQWVYKDGSSISYVRQVRKILTQDGVDARGKERVRGELVLARTIKADGTELEPITQNGGLLEFPGVEIGCYIDIAYLLHTLPNPNNKLPGDIFYFMDQNLSEPFGLSRWVIYNEGKPLQFIVRNNDGRLQHKLKQSSGFERHEWIREYPEHPQVEPYMPSPLEFIPWIECTDVHDWHNRARQAADYGLRRCRHTTKLLKKALELIATKTTDTEKAKAIYGWVNANIKTRGSTWNAHQTLTDLAGDRERLFIALCAAAKIDMGFAYIDRAQPLKLPDIERTARPSWMYHSDNDYSDFYIVVRDELGKRTWISMEHRLCPFGEISANISNAPAMLFEDGRYNLSRVPGQNTLDDRFESHLHLVLNADGSADVSGKLIFLGEKSWPAKETLSRTSEEDRNRSLSSEVSIQVPGFIAKELSHPELEIIGQPLTRKYKGKTEQLAEAKGDELSLALPLEKFGSLLSVLVATENRKHDLEISFHMNQYDVLRITPPKGYSFTSLPKSLMYPTAPLEYAFEVSMDGQDLVIRRSLNLGPGRFYPSNYADLQKQVSQIRKAEDTRITLKKN